jgi:hypothetical protein
MLQRGISISPSRQSTAAAKPPIPPMPRPTLGSEIEVIDLNLDYVQLLQTARIWNDFLAFCSNFPYDEHKIDPEETLTSIVVAADFKVSVSEECFIGCKIKL